MGDDLIGDVAITQAGANLARFERHFLKIDIAVTAYIIVTCVDHASILSLLLPFPVVAGSGPLLAGFRRRSARGSLSPLP